MWKKVKKILSSVLFGVFGFALSLCIAPIAAVAVVCYMTKVSFEIGYQDETVLQKDMNKRLSEIEESIE